MYLYRMEQNGKCYRNDEKDIWAAQLYQYMLLSNDSVYVDDAGKEQKRNILGGMIINLFSNEVHSYKFSWVLEDEDDEDEDDKDVRYNTVNKDVEFSISDEKVDVNAGGKNGCSIEVDDDIFNMIDSDDTVNDDDDSDGIKPIE